MLPLLIVGAVGVPYYYILLDAGPRKVEPQKPVSEVGEEVLSGGEVLKPDILVDRPEISLLDEGRVVLKVVAEAIKSSTDSGVTVLQKSKGCFYRDVDDQESRFDFEAPETIYDATNGSVEVRGNVRGTLLPEEFEVEAEGIVWNDEEGTLIASAVTIGTDVASMSAGSVEMGSKDRILIFRDGVKGVIK